MIKVNAYFENNTYLGESLIIQVYDTFSNYCYKKVILFIEMEECAFGFQFLVVWHIKDIIRAMSEEEGSYWK